jgi:hypothetical protein
VIVLGEGAEERRKEDSELLNDFVAGISYIEDNIEMSEEIETIDVNSLVGEYTVTIDGVPDEIGACSGSLNEQNKEIGTDLPESVLEENDVEIDPNEHPANVYRLLTSKNLNSQARKMLRRTKKKLKSVEIGDSVNVFVSQFD